MHWAKGRLRQQQQQPEQADVHPSVNYDSDNEPTFPDVDRDPRSPSLPNSPRRQPPDFNRGEEVRIHPLINGIVH
jgi:hypothetical protein